MIALPAAVVFDMDGTLTDSEEEWDIVRRGLAAADGVRWPESSTRAMMGMNTQEWSSHLSEVVGLHGTPEDAARRTIEGMTQAYRDGRIPILTGAVDAVRRMAAIAPLAVASSSPRVLITAGLELLGVADLVTVIVSTEDVEAGKPAPDGYLEACAQLGVAPDTALAVEDSTNGVASALAAGMKVIVVPPRFHPPAPEVMGRADAVLDSLDALTPELASSLFD